MDRETFDNLKKLNLPDIEPIPLEEFEYQDADLLKAKQNRSLVEYYFTCTPSLPLFILKHNPDVDLITYLDSDLFFFSNPLPLFSEIEDHSIAIIPHNFPPRLRHLENNGVYNVGWISFRRDQQGISCLERWRNQCLEWCYDKHEDGRYADQKYLDEWQDRYTDTLVIRHKGANLAHWNIENYELSIKDGQIYIDEYPLIFYHFQGLKQVRPWLYSLNFFAYSIQPSRFIRQKIYGPYIYTLINIDREVKSIIGEKFSRSSQTTIRYEPIKKESSIHTLLKSMFKAMFGVWKSLHGEYLFYICEQSI